MSEWLENVNVLELSATVAPANFKRKLFQKAIASPAGAGVAAPQPESEDSMVIDEMKLAELLAEATMGDDDKTAIEAAVKGLNKACGGMSDELKAALSGLMGKPVEGDDKMVELEDKMAGYAEKLEKAQKVAATAIDALQAPSPSLNEISVQLSEISGTVPTFKRIESLSPELKAEWEAMVKSREADRERLEKLEKSLRDKEAEAERQEYLAKARGFANVPAKPELVAELLQVVAEHSPADRVDGFNAFLKSVDELSRQSSVFSELGASGAAVTPGRESANARIDAAAAEIMKKSATIMTIEQARRAALQASPELYEEYNG